MRLMVNYLLSGICWFCSLWPSGDSFKSNSHRNVSQLLDNLLQGYDNSIRPDFGGPPTVVEIDIMVRSMGPISEVDMTYSMTLYFRQTWIDGRLSYSSKEEGTLALSISMLERIWKPDTYFYNGKQSYLHTITTPNKFVRLHQNGRVLYSSRLTVKANCPMDLSTFPMDIQHCPLKLGSFGYTTRDVLYQWNANRTIDIAPDMRMSQFDLISTPSGNSTDKMKSGEYSFLMVSFHLQRHMGNFLIQVYGPCTLLVVLSWVSFFLNREATADRVSLGVTTVLTMTFLGLEARNDLPKVPYPTALDFFVFLSFGFIFATIIQFAVVHFFTKNGSGEIYYNDDSSSEDNLELENQGTSGLPVGDVDRRSRMAIIQIPLPQLNNGRMGPTSSNMRISESQHYRRRGSNWVFCGRRNLCIKPDLESVNSVSKVDRFARVCFPLSFMAINVFYWYSYLYDSAE